jgi:hypothetical protein
MSQSPMRCTLAGGALLALGLAISPLTFAASPAAVPANAAPIVVAQAPAAPVTRAPIVVPVQAYPAYQRGVRQAAAEGPDALRRYIWRTRMIHNFYYNEFAIAQ